MPFLLMVFTCFVDQLQFMLISRRYFSIRFTSSFLFIIKLFRVFEDATVCCSISRQKDVVIAVPLKKSYGVIELSRLCMFAGQRMSRDNKWKRLTVDCQLDSGRRFVLQWIVGLARVIALIRSVQLGDVQSPCVQIIRRCDPAVSRVVYFCTVLQPCDGRFGFSFNLTFQRNTLSFCFCVARRLF